MRRAEWRRRPDDPKTAFGWWWQGISAWNWCLPVGIGAAVTSAWASTSGLPWFVDSLLFGVALGCLCGKRRQKDALAPLLPNPPPPGQFRATVKYRQNGTTTGTDEVAIVVVDGWLVAEGVRSSFALRPQDAYGWALVYARRAKITLTDGSVVELRWS